MRLVILKTDCNYRPFVDELVTYIQNIGPGNYNRAKEDGWNIYLNTKFPTSRKFDVRQIILQGFYNLVVSENNISYIIEIDNRVKVPYDNTLSLNTACRLINYGVDGRQGVNVFTDTFKYVQDNIKTLAFKYASIGKLWEG